VIITRSPDEVEILMTRAKKDWGGGRYSLIWAV